MTTPRLQSLSVAMLACASACAVDHAGRGQQALSRGDDAAAVASFERAVVADPTDGAAWRELARARMRTGRLESARQAIERSLVIEPRDTASRLLRGQIAMGLRDGKAAVVDASWVGERGRTPRELQEAAILLLRLGLDDQAMAAARRAIERSRGDASAYVNAAVLAVEARRGALAEQLLREGSSRHPHDVGLAEAHAAYLVSAGRLGEARTRYRELLARHDRPGLVHQALALLAHAEGDLTDALVHSRSAVHSLGDVRADVHFTHVVILRDMARLAEARSALATARRRFPGDGPLAELQVEPGTP